MQKANERNVLVLDDNKNDLLMAKFVIMRMGLQPILLDRSAALLHVLQTHSVALIVLDVDMPGLTGIDILKRVKRMPMYKNIPVVMLTGHSDAEKVKAAIQHGAADYIVKPIDPMIFESKIQKLITTNQTITQKDWIEYEITKTQKSEVKLNFALQLHSIGELGISLRCDQALPEGMCFFSDAELFTELEITAPALKVELSTPYGDGFIIKCSMMGLSESDFKKIRLYSKLLMLQAAV